MESNIKCLCTTRESCRYCSPNDWIVTVTSKQLEEMIAELSENHVGVVLAQLKQILG